MEELKKLAIKHVELLKQVPIDIHGTTSKTRIKNFLEDWTTIVVSPEKVDLVKEVELLKAENEELAKLINKA